MNISVLFVDDDLNLLDGLRRSLRNEPFSLHTAGSAEEAMEVLERNPVDVVVSDENMPLVSGTDFLSQLRHLYPGVVRILMTGNATAERAIQAINEGRVFRLLVKPCSQGDLVLALQHAAQQKHLQDRCLAALRMLKKQNRLLTGLFQVNRPLVEHVAAGLSKEGAVDRFDSVDLLAKALDKEVTNLSELLPTFR